MLWRILYCIYCIVMAAGLPAQEPAAQPKPAPGTSFEISGVLVDEVTGQPIPQARVAIAPVTQRDALTTSATGEDGQFVFRNLAPGKYALTGQQRGYLTRAFNQHEQFSSSIAVGPGLNSSGLVFRLPPQCAISGKISDEAGEPVVNAQVMLYETGLAGGEQGTRLHQQLTADEEGVYHFGRLSPGRYLLAVTAVPWYAERPATRYMRLSNGEGGEGAQEAYPQEQGSSPLDVAYPITFYPGVTDAGAAAPITVKEGERFVADITLQPVPALHIHIPLGEKGGTAPKASFILLEARLFDAPIRLNAETRVLPSGDVEAVGLPPGRYQAMVYDRNNNPGEATRSAELDALSSGEVSLEHEVFAVNVSATVQPEPGTAMPLHGNLQLSNPKIGQSLSEDIAAGGEITFKRPLPPGRYELSLSNSAGDFIKTVSATGGILRGRSVEVKGSALKLAVTIARGEGQVTGVALSAGKPVAGVMIVLVPADPAHNQVLFRRDQTNSDGSFTLSTVVPGKYTLLALEKGWDLEWMNPGVLKPYLAGGEALDVQPGGKHEVKVNVQ